MRTILITLAFTATLGTQAGASDADRKMEKLSDFIESNKVGDQDFWLQMDTSYGWANVALIMGYWDDYIACLELIDGLEATQFINKRNYRCIPANKK